MLCIPLDHGISSGPLRGIQNITELIGQTQDSGLTCFLVNKGIIKSLPAPPSIGLIAHMSAAYFPWPGSKQQSVNGLGKRSNKTGGRCCFIAH